MQVLPKELLNTRPGIRGGIGGGVCTGSGIVAPLVNCLSSLPTTLKLEPRG